MHFVLCSPQVWWLGALCNPMAGLEIVCSPKDAHTVSRNPIILPFPLNNKLRSQKKFQPWTNNNVAKSAPNKLALCRRRTTIVRKRGALAVKTGSRSQTSGGLISFHWFPQDYLALVSLLCFRSFPTIHALLWLLTSWSYCSFSALISELMLYFTLRVLSIRSDPFQELHMIIQIDTESGQKTFPFTFTFQCESLKA